MTPVEESLDRAGKALRSAESLREEAFLSGAAGQPGSERRVEAAEQYQRAIAHSLFVIASKLGGLLP